ncbi:MAG: hypothetical protein FWG10_04700 [Eubacteriaceae bacterium]|nr:hypothetical protein [Eubacteriaceae bacterium]
MDEKKEVVFSDYPEGWERCLEMISHIAPENRERMLASWLTTVLNY